MDIKVANRTCTGDNGLYHTFHYFLTVETIQCGHFFCENYGVRICEEAGETAEVPSITTSALRIDELITLLVEHQVGPASLADVVSDWLSI